MAKAMPTSKVCN